MFKYICRKSRIYTVNVQNTTAIHNVYADYTCRVVVLYIKGMGASIFKTPSQKRAFYDETYLKYPKFSSPAPAAIAIFTIYILTGGAPKKQVFMRPCVWRSIALELMSVWT